MIAAHEVGLADRIQCERTVVASAVPNLPLLLINPLGKLPTMVLDDGRPLYDSRVICEYLDTLHEGQRLFPSGESHRLQALRWQALGDGLMDLLLLLLGERGRPEEQRRQDLMTAIGLKLDAGFGVLEKTAPALAATPFGIGHISIGCALSYLDFRFSTIDWRAGRRALVDWHSDFSSRSSAKATAHQDFY